MTTRTLNLNADIIDSRDIIARLEELRSDAIVVLETMHFDAFEAGEYDAGEALDEMIDEGTLDIDPNLFDGTDELLMLTEINQEGENTFSDWTYGVGLISEDYFETYAEEFANDIGAIDSNASSWPAYHIDWKAAAEDLRQDYSHIVIDGNDYWGR